MLKTIIVGAVILFGLPIILGIAVAAWVGTFLGIISGVVIFLAIVFIALRYMKKEANKSNGDNDTQERE